METLLQKILEWNVIIQGAVGSALFWLIFILGQAILNKILKIVSSYSKNYRRESIRIKLFKHKGALAWHQEDSALAATFISGLFFRCSNHFIKGIIWLVLGLLFNSFISTFGVVGFLGALYYFFRTIEYFTPINTNINLEKKIAELQNEYMNAKTVNKIFVNLSIFTKISIFIFLIHILSHHFLCKLLYGHSIPAKWHWVFCPGKPCNLVSQNQTRYNSCTLGKPVLMLLSLSPHFLNLSSINLPISLA